MRSEAPLPNSDKDSLLGLKRSGMISHNSKLRSQACTENSTKGKGFWDQICTLGNLYSLGSGGPVSSSGIVIFLDICGLHLKFFGFRAMQFG